MRHTSAANAWLYIYLIFGSLFYAESPSHSRRPLSVSNTDFIPHLVPLSGCFICAVCLAHSIYIKSNLKPCTLTGSGSSNFQHVFAYAYVPPSGSSFTLPSCSALKASLIIQQFVCRINWQLFMLFYLISLCWPALHMTKQGETERKVMPGQYHVLSNIVYSQFYRSSTRNFQTHYQYKQIELPFFL